MVIRGLDKWLTTPPEEPDLLEEVDKLQRTWEPKDQREAYLLSIIDGLLEMVQDENSQ